MSAQLRLDLCIALLATGRMTAEQQIEMVNDLVPVSIELRKLTTALDYITDNARDDAEQSEQRAIGQKEAMRSANVVPMLRAFAQ